MRHNAQQQGGIMLIDYDKSDIPVDFFRANIWQWNCPECEYENGIVEPMAEESVVCQWCQNVFGIGEIEG